jgi:hypothetical protein
MIIGQNHTPIVAPASDLIKSIALQDTNARAIIPHNKLPTP